MGYQLNYIFCVELFVEKPSRIKYKKTSLFIRWLSIIIWLGNESEKSTYCSGFGEVFLIN